MTVREVLDPAISIASDGFLMKAHVASLIDNGKGVHDRVLAKLGRGFPAGWQRARGGSLFRWPAMAETYARIVTEAEAAGPDRENRSRLRGAPGTRVLSPKRSMGS